ncbi:MAG: class I SAM-dependent methyltransferase [Lachnospiraceae bacterium]|nr:class I SAM-dependent methyltransferase [Lachnospiraceae bacterium]MBD5541907.1 class I SAM-dependent methyltransferase [Lachnospiraceae bacterium]
MLDLGCGTGNLIQKIRNKYPNATIYALDFSKEMIQIAQSQNIRDIHYIVANMFDINIPYFDIVISSFVFHNFQSIDEHRNIFSLINEHLAVDGRLILADLIELGDCFQKKETQKALLDLMRNNNLSDDEIVKWLRILEIEDIMEKMP